MLARRPSSRASTRSSRSAPAGHRLEPLIARLAELIPEGPSSTRPEQRSDLPSEVLLAELIREQVLRRTREELPHAVEVEVIEVEPPRGRPGRRHAQIWAETDSQKGILIGRAAQDQGDRHRRPEPSSSASSAARVFLDLQVRVRRRWRRDEGLLDRLGIE